MFTNESNSSEPGNGSSTDDCYEEFESTEYKVAAALRAGVGFVSFLCCVGVVAVIILYKKYRFFTQRLILYLAVAAMIHSISYTLARVNYYTERPISDPYCYFGGLLNHYTAAVELLCVWCITVNLFVNVIFNRPTEKLELVYFVVSYFAPALWFWLPVWKKAYGTAGPWCGIRLFDDDCNEFTFGKWVIFGIWYIPLYISILVIFVASITIIAKVKHDSKKWEGALYSPQATQRKRKMSAEVKPLMWYPIVYLALTVFSLVSQVYNVAHPEHPVVELWYLRVLTSPLRGAFIALVFALDPETKKELKPSRLKAMCLSHCHRNGRVEEYGIEYEEFGDSLDAEKLSSTRSRKFFADLASKPN